MTKLQIHFRRPFIVKSLHYSISVEHSLAYLICLEPTQRMTLRAAHPPWPEPKGPSKGIAESRI